MANGAAAVARLDNWFWTSTPTGDALIGKIFDDPPPRSWPDGASTRTSNVSELEQRGAAEGKIIVTRRRGLLPPFARAWPPAPQVQSRRNAGTHFPAYRCLSAALAGRKSAGRGTFSPMPQPSSGHGLSVTVDATFSA